MGLGTDVSATCAGWGSLAAAATCRCAGEEARVIALTETVFTSTGRIGSAEPDMARADVAAVDGSGRAAVGWEWGTGWAAGCAGPAGGVNRIGTLTALATTKCGSTFAAALVSGLGGSALDAGFGSTLATTLGSGAGPDPVASATIGAVRLVEAAAICSLINSRMRASRLPALLPPITTATR